MTKPNKTVRKRETHDRQIKKNLKIIAPQRVREHFNPNCPLNHKAIKANKRKRSPFCCLKCQQVSLPNNSSEILWLLRLGLTLFRWHHRE